MEQKFVYRFYSTPCTVSMTELTNTKEWKGEAVPNYINCRHAFSLECRDRLVEASTIEMCTQRMEWDLVHVL